MLFGYSAYQINGLKGENGYLYLLVVSEMRRAKVSATLCVLLTFLVKITFALNNQYRGIWFGV